MSIFWSLTANIMLVGIKLIKQDVWENLNTKLLINKWKKKIVSCSWKGTCIDFLCYPCLQVTSGPSTCSTKAPPRGSEVTRTGCDTFPRPPVSMATALNCNRIWLVDSGKRLDGALYIFDCILAADWPNRRAGLTHLWHHVTGENELNSSRTLIGHRQEVTRCFTAFQFVFAFLWK